MILSYMLLTFATVKSSLMSEMNALKSGESSAKRSNVSQSIISLGWALQIISDSSMFAGLSLMIPMPKELESLWISFLKLGSSSILRLTKYPSFAQDEFETAWKKHSRRLE